MVIATQAFCVDRVLLFAAEHAGEAVLERLDPPRRAAVVMALLGLTLLGLFLIIFVMVGGHWVRKLARHRPGTRRLRKNTVSEGALREAIQNVLPELKSSDTVLLDTSSKDTKVET